MVASRHYFLRVFAHKSLLVLCVKLEKLFLIFVGKQLQIYRPSPLPFSSEVVAGVAHVVFGRVDDSLLALRVIVLLLLVVLR